MDAADPARRAAIVAHYHPEGRIPRDLRELLDELARRAGRVLFVSTRVDEAERASLPAAIEAVARPNEGYDFGSWRQGLALLGARDRLDEIVLVNSSFVCVDAPRFASRLLDPGIPADLVGITSSGEGGQPHLQSYALAFRGRSILDSTHFAAWWDAMPTLSARDDVIRQLELGLSRHFGAAGFRLAAAFSPTPEMRFRALCRWFDATGRAPPADAAGRVTLDLAAADLLNPTHVLWDELLLHAGIAKIELLRRNPVGVNLARLPALLAARPDWRERIEDALA